MLGRLSPGWMIGIGFLLVLAGAVIPWLIVLQVIPSTWALNFLSFGASMVGLMLGVAGTAYLVRLRKGKE
ncbi:MAG TPA: hypothetical protein PKO09_04045 [Anaerolineae bacterium]|nr:hypothetical protein [Anaerolineae bacterium]